MKYKRILAVLCAAVLLLSGCGGSGAPAYDKMMSNDAAAPEAAPDMESPSMEETQSLPMAPEYGGSGRGESVYQRADAKLIRRCSMEIQTTEFDAAINALYELVEAQGGYFENSSVYGGGYYNANARRTGEYIIRIPAGQYHAFRSGVGDLGYVRYSNESTEDIGEQYYDTEARLKTLRTKQERLLMLLEKAETMEDIISLESALGDVEYEIERYSSTLNRYDGLVNYATFTVNVSEVARVEESTGEADALSARMGAGFRSGLQNLKDGVEDLMVWASYNFVGLVFLICAAGVVVVVVRRKKLRIPRVKGRGANGTEDSEN